MTIGDKLNKFLTCITRFTLRKILGYIRNSRCTTSINDTGVNDTAANLPPVSTSPAANFSTSFASVVDTGGKFATGVNDTSGQFATGVRVTVTTVGTVSQAIAELPLLALNKYLPGLLSYLCHTPRAVSDAPC